MTTQIETRATSTKYGVTRVNGVRVIATQQLQDTLSCAEDVPPDALLQYREQNPVRAPGMNS